MEMFMAAKALLIFSRTKNCGRMHTKEIGENLFLIDLETGGFKNLIASYVLRGAKTIIVETGPSSSISNLLSGLKELSVKPEDVAYVAVSHVHVDHAGGAGALLKFLPNATVVVHARGAPHMVNPEKLWLQTREVLGDLAEVYGVSEPVPEDRITIAADNAIFDVGNNVKLRAVETLGHASHHLSYYDFLNKGVFPGDAAGVYVSGFNVVVPTSPPPFHLDSALASLRKLISLKPKALYYSHFGKASGAVMRLKDYALQIKLWAKIAEEGVRNRQSSDAVRERILAEDKVMRRTASFLRSHPIFRKTVIENSAQGFIDFAEKSWA
jgi:glyoxylase-like metal-dependent hydrolase (beta-lactamase superfamily II)